MKKEKVYHVEFMKYTDAVKDTVARYTDVQKYRDFGGGYKSLIFVGFIEV